jgi:hypothetical protein
MISSYIAQLETLIHIRALVSRLACYYSASYRAAWPRMSDRLAAACLS